MLITGIAAATFVATFLGGMLALYFRDRMHLILGFSAGAVIGVAFFDLLPEALELAEGSYDVGFVTGLIAIGFLGYLVLDRLVVLHLHHENHGHAHAHAGRGAWGAATLALHSFIDGLGIGLAFQVSFGVGAVVALAVLAHNFSDGLNTVNMIVKSGGSRSRALRWLSLDAVAPAAGVLVSPLLVVSEAQLGLLLAVFCGFFLYLGAAELVPESHHAHPKAWTTISTVLGVVALYLIIRTAGL